MSFEKHETFKILCKECKKEIDISRTYVTVTVNKRYSLLCSASWGEHNYHNKCYKKE